ncbi:MAG: geranylgeranyl reductase family protein [Thermomicrobiales bacterium]
MPYDCDIIIAGASYAGLTAARHLHGAGARVLLIDEHAIGAIRHSACALPTRTLAAVGGLASACQETAWGEVHTKFNSVRFRWPTPWTVVDHRAFCLALRAQAPDVPFLQARISAFDGTAIVTNKGTFTARQFVDATGWRAVLASSLCPTFVDRGHLTLGIEVSVPGSTDALHFYADKEIVANGYGWVFPCGSERRIGLVAFDNAKGMSDRLRAFLAYLNIACDLRDVTRNGGFLPSQDRPAVLGMLWMLGDAAGHCMPLTGEGIRFALQDGDTAGRLLRTAFDQRMSWEAVGGAYAAAVARHRGRVNVYARMQALVPTVPNAAYAPIVWLLARRTARVLILRRYMAWEHAGVSLTGSAALWALPGESPMQEAWRVLPPRDNRPDEVPGHRHHETA